MSDGSGRRRPTAPAGQRDGVGLEPPAHAQRPPPAPSSVVPGVPAELDALVLRCLAKEPSERPATCEVLRDLLLATGLAERWDQDAARLAWGEGPLQDASGLGNAETIDL